MGSRVGRGRVRDRHSQRDRRAVQLPVRRPPVSLVDVWEANLMPRARVGNRARSVRGEKGDAMAWQICKRLS